MADLKTCAAMGYDTALRIRMAAAVVRLAVEVISAPLPPEEDDPRPLADAKRRRAYALDVTTNVPTFAERAQWALACAATSPLPDMYAQGGSEAISDEALMATLRAVWDATGSA